MLLEKYDLDNITSQIEIDEERRPLVVTKEHARRTLMTKINRSGGLGSVGKKTRLKRSKIMTRGNSFAGSYFGQRVVVKIRFVKHKNKSALGSASGLLAGAGRAGGLGIGRSDAGRSGGGVSAISSHVKYISRGEAGKDGEKAILFNAVETGVAAGAFVATCEPDRHHWRFIISPENGHQIEDFQGYVRGIMVKVEKDLGTELEWVAAVHYDTDNPHAHVIVRGKNDREEDLVIGKDYIMGGGRRRAQEVVTELLGERSLDEIQKSLEAEVDALRVTSVDRFIEKQASQNQERKVDVRKKRNFGRSQFDEGLIKGRLKYLAAAGLAIEKPPGEFTLKEGYKEVLAEIAQKDDVIKRLYKSSKKIDRSQLDGIRVYSLNDAKSRDAVIEGRIVDKGLHDEESERKYVVIKDMVEKLHYVPITELLGFEKLKEGTLVRVGSSSQSTGKADLNIAEQAGKNGGIYDLAKHKAHIERNMQFIPEEDRPKYLDRHQVRLETLVKNDVVKDLGEGRYEIPADVVVRGAEINREMNARENKRFYPRLTVLSARSPEKLVAAQKRTWLDTELQQQAKGKPSLSSYDTKLLHALEERKKWLVEKDLGVIQSNGEFALRTGALKKLDRMEVYAAGELLAGKLGLKFNDQMVSEGVAMRFEDDIQLETGTWAVVSKGRSLHMMPVDEQSKAVSGQQVTFKQLESGKFEAQPAKARSQSRDRDKDQEMEL